MREHETDESLLRCVCGHAGKIKKVQSDKGWGSPCTDYSITGYGNEVTVNIEKWSTFKDAILELKPKCPACGAMVAPSALSRT